LDPNPVEFQSELVRRQKAAARTVLGLVVAVILLSLVAFVSRERLNPFVTSTLDVPLRIILLTMGLGSIVWRRTKFQAMRLQDIGALQGPVGLVRTLERTTIQLAILAAAIAIIGLVGTVLMANEFYTYTASAIALIVLLYAYPIKASWERTVNRFGDSSTAKPTLG